MKSFLFWPLIIASLLVPIGSSANPQGGEFGPGTMIGPVAVGGLNRTLAIAKLNLWWQEESKLDRVFSVGTSGKSLSANFGDIGIALDATGSVDAARQTETPPSQSVPVHHSPKLVIDSYPFDLFCRRAESLLSPMMKSTVRYINGEILVQKGRSSGQVDSQALLKTIDRSFGNGYTISVPILRRPDAVPVSSISQISAVLSSYTTRFPSRLINRCENIALAASKLDGTILIPGQKMSFNETVGPRSRAAGFKPAGVFINGKLGTGVGGGVCQVSSTTYNAALLANLKIVHRYCHSLRVPYLPMGRDATVDYGLLDLVVQNTGKDAVAFSTEVTRNHITVRVLGNPVDRATVRVITGRVHSLPPTTVYETDSKLQPGQSKVADRGSDNSAVNTYRYVYREGVLVRKERLGMSIYHGHKRIVEVPPRSALTDEERKKSSI